MPREKPQTKRLGTIVAYDAVQGRGYICARASFVSFARLSMPGKPSGPACTEIDITTTRLSRSKLCGASASDTYACFLPKRLLCVPSCMRTSMFPGHVGPGPLHMFFFCFLPRRPVACAAPTCS